MRPAPGMMAARAWASPSAKALWTRTGEGCPSRALPAKGRRYTFSCRAPDEPCVLLAGSPFLEGTGCRPFLRSRNHLLSVKDLNPGGTWLYPAIKTNMLLFLLLFFHLCPLYSS